MQIPWPLHKLTKSESEPVQECILKLPSDSGEWPGLRATGHHTHCLYFPTTGSWIRLVHCNLDRTTTPPWLYEPGPLLLSKLMTTVISNLIWPPGRFDTDDYSHSLSFALLAFFGTTLSWFLGCPQLLFFSFLGNFMDSSSWSWNVSQDSLSHSFNKLLNANSVLGIVLESRYWV